MAAFWYDVKVPKLESNSSFYKFVEWLVPDGSNISGGTALAIIADKDKRYTLRNAGPGFFSPWKIKSEDEIAVEQVIGRMTTDGDLIPYGRPYVIAEPIQEM